MEALPRDEVLHIADLGKIKLSEEEIDKFGYGLKQIWNEIEKINNLDIASEEILISPTENYNIYRDDVVDSMISIDDALRNAPKTKENYIEVVRVVND